MRNVTIKGLLAHKLRLALTSLAIVLGVTFIAGTFVLTDTLHNVFYSLVGNVYQKVDFEVRGVAQFPGNSANAVRNPLPEPLLATVRRVPGVEAAYGEVEGYAQFVSHQGQAISTGGAATLGIDFDPDQRISELRLVQGRPPTTPHDVVMDAGTAEKYHFKLGQSVRVLSSGPPARLYHHRHRPVRQCEQPGRSYLRGVHAPNCAGNRRRSGPARRHQRRCKAGR